MNESLPTLPYFYRMFAARHIPYQETNAFSKIVVDYLAGEPNLKPFFSYPPDLNGLKEAIANKQLQNVDRAALVAVLQEQYNGKDDEPVRQNIKALLSANTFTICTAHQPNLFTGPLYFIYKILHAIKLAEHFSAEFKDFKFVPVFYMGSEDADFEELNHFSIEGKRYEWKTGQKGAVGRMFIDKALIVLLKELERQVGVATHGNDLIKLLKECYREGKTIQQGTFDFVNALFGKYGLVVLIADDARLKTQMQPVFKADLFDHTPSAIVEASCQRLSEHYNVQATPRNINLFYLKGDLRERIERTNTGFSVINTDISFTEDEMQGELKNHPERFSPNVILRGLYQETILPNIAFIGGGGELAYWLQLKDLFQHHAVSFPVLVLRNSLLIIQAPQQALIEKLQLSTEQLFVSKLEILNAIIEREGRKPELGNETKQLEGIYENLKQLAAKTDPTLAKHVQALQKKAVDSLMELEKKILRSERKKMDAASRQVDKLKDSLFPKGGLQERVENIGGYYAKWGPLVIDELYKQSLPLESKFTVLTETL